jgi:hypothetical protein
MAVDDSAQLQGSDNRVFHGREATVRMGEGFKIIDDSGSGSPSADGNQEILLSTFKEQTLDVSFENTAGTTVNRSGIITEITVTDPEATVEVQDTFGGQVMTESPHDLVEIEFTARFQDRDFLDEINGSDESVGDTEFTRTSGGTQIGNRPNRSILFRLEKKRPSGTDNDIVNYLMNNAIFQQMGEISLAGDDAAEITGTAVCRVADRFTEDNL